MFQRLFVFFRHQEAGEQRKADRWALSLCKERCFSTAEIQLEGTGDSGTFPFCGS